MKQAVKASRFFRCGFLNLLPEGLLRTIVCAQHGLSEEDEPGILSALGDDLPGAVTVSRIGDPVRGSADDALRSGDFASSSADSLIRASIAGMS